MNTLIHFLFINFTGNHFADETENELQHSSQNIGKQFINYHQRGLGKVKEFSVLIKMIQHLSQMLTD